MAAPGGDARPDARTLGVAARLADGVTVEQAQADLVRLSDVWTKEFPETTADHQMRVIPFGETIGSISGGLQ